MLSRRDIEALIEREAKPESPVLSVYLDVDQSRAVNLNRGFEAALGNMLRSIERQLEETEQREKFTADAQRIQEFIANYTPSALSLILFCDASENFLWQRELRAPIRSEARWSAPPYLRPLLEVLDEYERYGVIVADRRQARLFTVFMGEIEEHQDVFNPVKIKLFRTTGTDRWRSQMNFERKVDVHARWHLKHVADLMDHLALEFAFDRLVLAGTSDVTSELYHLLPKRLRSRVVATLHLPMYANPQEVLDSTLGIERDVQRAEEKRLAEDLVAAAAGNERAVMGLDQVLATLQQERVWRLVYAEGFTSPGWECRNCSALFSKEQSSCLFCSATVQRVDDVTALIIQRVADMSGRVEEVRGEAAARLNAAGGIGAYLRF